MRVIAGSARGLRLAAPPGTGTRPTTDRVREATFNALGSLGAVAGARVLDAFAGSGALGIEALSRGAAHCTFVEVDRAARDVVEANLATTGVGDRASVVAADVVRHLATTDHQWDLVLLDPPHAAARWPDVLGALVDRVGEGAVVVVESDGVVVDGDEDPSWTVLREKRYGGTVVQMITARPGER